MTHVNVVMHPHQSKRQQQYRILQRYEYVAEFSRYQYFPYWFGLVRPDIWVRNWHDFERLDRWSSYWVDSVRQQLL